MASTRCVLQSTLVSGLQRAVFVLRVLIVPKIQTFRRSVFQSSHLRGTPTLVTLLALTTTPSLLVPRVYGSSDACPNHERVKIWTILGERYRIFRFTNNNNNILLRAADLRAHACARDTTFPSRSSPYQASPPQARLAPAPGQHSSGGHATLCTSHQQRV